MLSTVAKVKPVKPARNATVVRKAIAVKAVDVNLWAEFRGRVEHLRLPATATGLERAIRLFLSETRSGKTERTTNRQ